MPKFIPFHCDESQVRQFVEREVAVFLAAIKVELEDKIRYIDSSLLVLRKDFQKLIKEQRMTIQLYGRIDRIYVGLKELKFVQQNSLRQSRTHSISQERKPIFHKFYIPDMTSLVLGLTPEEYKEGGEMRLGVRTPPISKKAIEENDKLYSQQGGSQYNRRLKRSQNNYKECYNVSQKQYSEGIKRGPSGRQWVQFDEGHYLDVIKYWVGESCSPRFISTL